MDPLNPYAAPQVQAIEAPGARWVREVSPSLRQTALGLSLIYYGIITVLISFLVIFLGGMTAAMAGRGGAGGLLEMGGIVLLGLLGLIAGAILMFVGPLVCLAVPAETGAKGLIIASVVLQGANILFAVVSNVAPKAFPPAVALIFNLLGLAAFVLFVLFMKRLSEYIGRQDLAQRAINVLIGWAITIGLLVLMVVGVLASGPTRESLGIAGLLGIVVVIAALVVFVMYANLINGLRKALTGN